MIKQLLGVLLASDYGIQGILVGDEYL